MFAPYRGTNSYVLQKKEKVTCFSCTDCSELLSTTSGIACAMMSGNSTAH
jgi:hypothetical protein